MMKRACGASQNWQWREARCSQYLEYWQAERQSQRRFWPQPLVGWRDFGLSFFHGRDDLFSQSNALIVWLAKIVTA